MKNSIISFLVLVLGIGIFVLILNDQSVQIKMKYGSKCAVVRTCNDMVYVDCGAATDGPAYYLDKNLTVIGTSGGLCIKGCTGAPKEWENCSVRPPKVSN